MTLSLRAPKPEVPDPFYGHEDTARLCARFITDLFACPDQPSPPTAGSSSSASASLLDPVPPLASFIAYALHRTRLHSYVTFTALSLLQRLKTWYPTALSSSGNRLSLAASYPNSLRLEPFGWEPVTSGLRYEEDKNLDAVPLALDNPSEDRWSPLNILRRHPAPFLRTSELSVRESFVRTSSGEFILLQDVLPGEAHALRPCYRHGSIVYSSERDCAPLSASSSSQSDLDHASTEPLPPDTDSITSARNVDPAPPHSSTAAHHRPRPRSRLSDRDALYRLRSDRVELPLAKTAPRGASAVDRCDPAEDINTTGPELCAVPDDWLQGFRSFNSGSELRPPDKRLMIAVVQWAATRFSLLTSNLLLSLLSCSAFILTARIINNAFQF